MGLYVVTLELVRSAIRTLQGQRIHNHFPGYMLMRRLAAEGADPTNLPFHGRDLIPMLEVPNGPPGRPVFRPFSSRMVKDPSNWWMSPNQAGSYAPSSIRKTAGFLLDEHDRYHLTEGNAREALSTFLRGERAPAWAIAAYFMRNHGFEVPYYQETEARDILVGGFRSYFGFSDEDDFDILFDAEARPDLQIDVWLEPWTLPKDGAPASQALEEAYSTSSMSGLAVAPNLRVLDADELGIGYDQRATSGHGSSAPDAPKLDSSDPLVTKAGQLLNRYGGVILTGPPGTGKSWLAGQLGDLITEADETRRVDVQFHASYQYEDFIEGYRPDPGVGTFVRHDGVLMRLARKAEGDRDRIYVIIIDELSRADVGRVFGEALTYIERSKRGLPFSLPSGEIRTIPRNLYMIATMNPLDRGVDEVDAAFERRFAKIDMPPDAQVLEVMLTNREVSPTLVRRIVGWFRRVNAHATQNPAAAIGHAYFSDVVDLESLQDLWEYQLKYAIDRAFRFDPDGRAAIVAGWESIHANLTEEQDALGAGEG